MIGGNKVQAGSGIWNLDRHDGNEGQWRWVVHRSCMHFLKGHCRPDGPDVLLVSGAKDTQLVAGQWTQPSDCTMAMASSSAKMFVPPDPSLHIISSPFHST